MGLLQLPTDEQIELLVGPTELDVSFECDGVIPLHEGIQEFVDCDGPLGLIALAEVVPLEHPRDCVLRSEPDDIRCVHVAHPPRVEFQPRMLRVENLVNLLLVGSGVILNLLGRQRRARGSLSGRISDHAGEIADQEYDLVPELLELAHLVQKNRMPQMKVRGRWVEACFNPQRPTQGQSVLELAFEQYFFGAAAELPQLVINRLHGQV